MRRMIKAVVSAVRALARLASRLAQRHANIVGRNLSPETTWCLDVYDQARKPPLPPARALKRD